MTGWTQGVVLCSGTVVPWDQLQAGRYDLAQEDSDRMTVSFCRVSTEDQVRGGCSLQQQVEYALGAAARSGATVSALYVDPGHSAVKLTFDRRPGIRSLIEDIKRRKIRIIYAYKRDRIARQSLEWVLFLKTCATWGTEVRFTCPEEPPVGQGAYGMFAETLIISAAELEVNLTRMRVRDNIQNRFQNGQWIGGKLAYGLTHRADGEIVLHEAEAPVVREIFRLAAEELLGDLRIAQRVNRAFPLSRQGRPWTRIQVMRVLTNPIYCGRFRLTTTVQENGQSVRRQLVQPSERLPLLVSPEVWERVRALRAARTYRSRAGGARHRASPYLLAGLVRCGCCGRALATRHMVQRHRRKDGSVAEYHLRYMICPNGMNLNGCDYRGQVNQEHLEAVVLDAIGEHLIGRVTAQELMQAARAHRGVEAQGLLERCDVLRKEISRQEVIIRRNQASLEAADEACEVTYYQARIRGMLLGLEEQRATLAELEELWRGRTQAADRLAVVRVALAEWQERFMLAPQPLLRRFMLKVVDSVVWHSDANDVDIRLAYGRGEADAVFYAE